MEPARAKSVIAVLQAVRQWRRIAAVVGPAPAVVAADEAAVADEAAAADEAVAAVDVAER